MFYWKLIALCVSFTTTWASDISMLDLMNACKRSQVCTIIDAEALQSCQVDPDYEILKSSVASELDSGIPSDIEKDSSELLEEVGKNSDSHKKIQGADLGGKTGSLVPGYVPTPTGFETVKSRKASEESIRAESESSSEDFETDELESSSMPSGDEEVVESPSSITSSDTGEGEFEMIEEDEMEASSSPAAAEVDKHFIGKRSIVMEPVIPRRLQRSGSIMTDKFSKTLHYGGLRYNLNCLPFPVQDKIYYPYLGSCKKYFEYNKITRRFTLRNCPANSTPLLRDVCDWGILVCARNYDCNHSIFGGI